MNPSFQALAPGYAALIARATVLPAHKRVVAETAERLRRDKANYLSVQEKTGVPAAALMALAEREMDGNLNCYLGNGQPLRMRTTIVPLHRGPFADFVSGCLDALHLDGLDAIAAEPGGWSMERFCYESELWNGFGYRAHGIPSPYVFGGTTVQRPGKYVRDHDFDPNEMDPQIGTLAIVEELVAQDPSLAFGQPIVKSPPAPDEPPIVVAPHPVIARTDTAWLQRTLNALRVAGTPLRVDNNYGRNTARAVRAFQIAQHIAADGLAGPITVARLKQALAEDGR